MEPEVQLVRLAEMIDQVTDVALETVIVEGFGVHVLQGAVLRCQVGADGVIPVPDDLVRWSFGQCLGGLLGSRPERRVQPRNGPQHGRRGWLARRLVGADQGSQSGVHEPVDETLFQTFGRHADLGEHPSEPSAAPFTDQRLYDRCRPTGEM